MRNSDSDSVARTSSSSLSWKTLLVLGFIVYSASSIRTVVSESDGDKSIQWQILTKQNFSSQIRLQPHLLLMVTVPWSGESRSLMKELAQVVNNKQEKFGTLKLMLLYRSIERMLADVLGATEGITILYFHQSLAYKYQGRLRAQNILSSVHFVMSHFPEDFPLKSINTPKDLKIFLESTDKALLLLEFCGWTPRLLVKGKNNGTESAFEELSGTSLHGETDRALAVEGKKNEKRIENEKMKCGLGNEFTGIPWLWEFSPVNDSAFLEDENMRPGDGLSCSFEEFQRFESFFTKFMTVVREFSLPPERLRFGLVSKRLLLSYLGVGDSGSWLMMLYFVGCPSCSKVLREGDDLKSGLRMHNSLVTELEGDGHELEPSLPANKPSILLFIDRSSDSLRTRSKSKEALNVFRDLALRYQMGGQNKSKPIKSSVEVYQAWKSISGSRRLEMPPTSRKITLKNKMSIMITNTGKQVTLDDIASDLKANSLHEILAYALQQKKEVKLSSLAREAGFQLLSDDFDIKIAEALPSQTEIVHSNQISTELPMEDLKSSVDLKKDQIPHVDGVSAWGYGEQSEPIYGETPEYNDEKTSYLGANTPFSAGLDQHHTNQVLASAEDGMGKEKTNPKIENSEEQQLHFKGFMGSFFFSDGGYRLLKALTGGSNIPAVVIIDPSLNQHYVLPEETTFSYSALSDFLEGLLNGSLLPYQRSESVVLSPREAPIPPFVNLDFHEVDYIPHVTTHTFSEMVLGFNQSDTTNAGHAWKSDVLVLFSNNWCGFCQRMELIVREVYRALKGYANILKNGARNEKTVLSSDDLKYNLLKLPLIYFMDCMLNDCSLILRSMSQRELYPALLLFPAERKNTVCYEGDMSVLDIIKFIADHGHNSQSLVRGKGNLWAGVEQGSRNQNSYEEALKTAVCKEASLAREKYHAVLLKNRAPKIEVKYNWIRPQTPNGLHGTAPQVDVGSILHSTDKLVNVHIFDKSVILIVKVDQVRGFQGLIINKHISWDALHELEEGLEQLKESPLSFGGPVVKRGMPLVALTRRVFKVQYPEILPNVYFLDQQATIDEIEGFKLGNQSVTDYWFFLGYSRWDRDQLFHEIAEGAWNISNGNIGLLDWPMR